MKTACAQWLWHRRVGAGTDVGWGFSWGTLGTAALAGGLEFELGMARAFPRVQLSQRGC